MSIDTSGILLKAAEDVQSGMWCQGEYFKTTPEGYVVPFDFLPLPDQEADEEAQSALERAFATKRCALGSLALATKLLGGDQGDWDLASVAVQDQLDQRGFQGGLAEYNDDHLPGDPFEAGQQLAELFRQTADSL